MLVDSFIKPLSQPAFEDNRAHLGVVNRKKNNWIEVLKIYNKDDGCSIFRLFFIYNKPEYWAAGLRGMI